MSSLILVDVATAAELGRRPMEASERFAFYEVCCEHQVFAFEQKQYRAHRGAWQVPQHDFVVWVTFDSVVPVDPVDLFC